MPRNARDQHMMTTILRLRGHSRELFGLDEKELLSLSAMNKVDFFAEFLKMFS